MACIDPPSWGHVAEWLRNGLQNRVHQFNSGRGLHSNLLISFKFPRLGLFLKGRFASALLAKLVLSILDRLLQSSVHPGSRFLLHARNNVAVEVQGNTDLAVA